MATSRGERRPISAAARWALPVALWLMPHAALAQEQQLAVVVDQIAGSNVYITAGQADGISESDTLLVSRDSLGPPEGRVIVVAASRNRSVLELLDDPFPITRGGILHLTIRGASTFTAAVNVPSATQSPGQRRRRTGARGPRAHGRISLDFSGLHSTTIGLGRKPEETKRTFATPALRLRATVSQLPGGLLFNTSIRASTRYSSGGVIEPKRSFRMYQASIGNLSRNAPVQFQFGRFYNPFETYGGYWDGGMLRLGGRSFGVGVAAGFNPERANEMFSTDIAKYAAFVNFEHRGRSATYATSLSVHQERPRQGLPNHTFVGWSQDVRLGPWRVAQRLQVDRNPITADWTVTYLRLQTVAAVARGFTIDAHYSLRSPYIATSAGSAIAPRREAGGAGVTFSGRAGMISVDITANRVAGGNFSFAYGASFAVPQTSVLGIGINSSARYANVGNAKTLYINPGLSRTFRNVHIRTSFSHYETDGINYSVVSRAADLSLVFPVTGQLYASVLGRTQHGSNLSSNSLLTSLWLTF